MKKVIGLLTSLICIALGGASAHAATKYWAPTGCVIGGAGTWNTTASQWSPNSTGGSCGVWVNTASDVGVFSGTATYVVSIGTPITVNQIQNLLAPTATSAGHVSFSGATGPAFAGTDAGIDVAGTFGVVTIDGIYSGTLTKTGPGRFQGNNNSNTAKYVLKGGAFAIAAPGRLGTATGSDFITFDGGGVGSSSTANDVATSKGFTIKAGGGFFGGSAAGNQWIIAGPIIDGTSGAGPGGLSATGGGPFVSPYAAGCVLVLSNRTATANNYVGATTIGASCNIRLGFGDQIPDGSVLTMGGSGATFNMNAFNDTIKSVSGAAGTVSVGASILTIDNPAGETYSSVFTGTGKIIKNGSGALSLGAGSSTGWTGEWIINNGTIGIGGANNFGNAAGATVSINGGKLANTGAGGRTIPAAVSLNISNDFTVDDSLFTTSANGQILFNCTTITLKNGNRTINVDQPNGQTVNLGLGGTVGEDVAGRAIIKTGSGIMALVGNNTFTGGVTNSAGTININGTVVSPFGTGALVLNGGKLTTTATRDVTTAPVTNAIVLATDGEITTSSAATTVNLNLTGPVSGSGKLTFRNDGADAASDQFEPRFSSGGSFSQQIGITNGAVGATRLSFFNVSPTTQTFSGVISGDGSIRRSSSTTGTGGDTVFSAANTFSGGTSLGGGYIGFGIDSSGPANAPTAGPIGTGTLTINSDTTIGVYASGGTRTVGNSIIIANTSPTTIKGTDDLTLSGNIDLGAAVRTLQIDNSGVTTLSGVMSGTGGGVTKSGSGVLTLTGANNYTGNTTISIGTLALSGTGSINNSPNIIVSSGATLDVSGITGGSYSLASGQTLKGNGGIKGTIVVASGATVAPGTSIGTIYFTNAPTLSGTTSMEIDRGASPNADKLVVVTGGGALVYGGTLSVVNIGAALQLNDTFDLFDADSFSGVFTATNLPSVTGLTWDLSQLYVDGSIKVVCSGTLSANAGADKYICSGGSTSIGGSPTASGGSGTGYMYSWSPPTGLDDATIPNPTASPSSTTTYTVTVTDSLGCTSMDSVTVNVDAPPTITAQPTNQTACEGTAASFYVTATGSGLGYSWSKKNNGGWGSAWSTSGSGSTFRGSSTDDNFGDAACTGFSSANDINSPSGNALGMWGGFSGDHVATRNFAALTAGQSVSVDFDNGNVDGGSRVGFSLQTSGGSDVLQFYFLGGASNYKYNDGTEQDTGVGFLRTGLRVRFILLSGSSYKLIVTTCAGSTTTISGSYSGTIEKIKLFNQNNTGGSDKNIYFNNFIVGGYVDNADNYSGDYSGQDKGEQPIVSGNGSSSYTTPTLALADNGAQYQVVVYGCNGTVLSSAATLTVNQAATVNAGADQTVCASSPAVTLAGSIGGGATSATWSGGAGSFSPNNTTLNAIYTPTAGEITAGTVTLTLTTDDPSGPCGAVFDSMTITINPAATVSAGSDQTVCSSSPAVTLAGSIGGAATSATWSGGAGSFSPDNTTLNAIYTPTAGEITAGTVTLTLTTDDPSGPCGAVFDSMTITINPAATVNAGADQTVCASSPAVTLAGSIGGGATSATWSGGAGGFSPNNTTLNAIYTPTAGEITAGTVTLTLTTDDPSGPCGAVFDSMTITINPAATVSAGSDQTVCSSSPAVTLAGSIGGAATSATWSGGAGSFSPDNTTLNAIYTPTAGEITAGTVTLTLTTDDPSGPCGAVFDSMTITITEAPTITAQPTNLTVCAGSPAIFSVGTTGAGLTYQWQVSGDGGTTFTNISDTATNASYTNLSATLADGGNQYQVIVNGACPPAVTSAPPAVLMVNPPATVNAGSDQTVCASSPVVTLAGSIGGGASSANWSGGAGGIFTPNSATLNATYTPTAEEITAGTVTLTLTTDDPSGPCGAVFDSMTITIDPAATANAGADQTVCASSPAVTLAGSVGGAATSGTWSGGAGSFNPNNTTLNAIYTPTAGEITAGTVTLTLTTDDPSGPCGAVFDSMTITINPAATVNAGADQTVCASSPAVTLAGSVGGAATSGTWSGGAGSFNPNNTTLNAIYTPTAGEITAGTVTLTLTTDDPSGPCGAVFDSMTITINPAATVNAGADQTVCVSSPAVTLAGSVGGAATSGTWSGGAGSFNPNNTTLNAIYTPTAGEITAGTVTLTLTTDDPSGPCEAVFDSMTITINPAATANAGVDQTVCASSPAVTLAGSVGGAATSGTWSGGAGSFNPNNTTLNATYTPTAGEITAGTVTLTLTTDDPSGPCGSTNDSMTITINPAATVNAGVDQTVCASSPAVTLAGSVGGAATSGTWSGGAGSFSPDNTTLNATYTPTAGEITAGTVTLTLTTDDPSGPCGVVFDSMVISINPAPTLSPATLNDGTFGVSYSNTVVGVGGSAPYSYAVTSGSLPSGLSLNTTNGLIDGTPDILGTNIFTITATDANGCTGSSNYTVVIGCGVITLSPGSLPSATKGSPYSQAISASGGAGGETFAVTVGTLPNNVTLTGAGLLSGTPTNIGTINFTVTATDTNNCTGSQAYSLTILPSAPDTKGPTVTVTAPTANQNITTVPFLSYGKANDDNYVSDVQYRTIFAGTTSAWTSVTSLVITNPKIAYWSASIALNPGTNSIEYKAVDLSGNYTTNAQSRKVFVAAEGIYTLTTNGFGDIKPTIVAGDNPGTNGAPLKIGRVYNLEAKIATSGPGTDYLFSNWVAVANGGPPTFSTSTKFSFVMQSNMIVTANFVTNRFIGAAGTYYGLFSDPLGVAHQSSGWFTLKTDAKQKFSGKILLQGEVVPVSGTFDQAGHGLLKVNKAMNNQRAVARKGMTNYPIVVELDLDLGSGDVITGTVTNAEGWTAELSGGRAVFNVTSNPATNYLQGSTNGQFTFVYPGSLTAATEPGGDGYGLLTLATNGIVKPTGGRAGDYHLLKSTLTSITKDGAWPFYAPLYTDSRPATSPMVGSGTTKTYKGSVFGWLSFTNDQVTGDLFWNKVGWTNGYYNSGFTNTQTILGSGYVKSIPTLPAGAMTATLADGNLPDAITNNAYYAANNYLYFTNVVPPVNTNGIKGKVVSAKGEFSGSFSNSVTSPALKSTIKGVVLQNLGEVRGVFLGTNNSGSIRITP